MPQSPTARVLARVADAAAVPDDRGGAVWRLAEPGRQLDANIIRVRPGARIDSHVESDLDVLLCVLTGSGELESDAGPQPLEPGAVAWLPRGARRALSAGPDGLVCLTSHPRRPGLSITRAATGTVVAPETRPGDGGEGGEAACMLNRICPGCDLPAESVGARHCSRCGTRLPS
ncbi:cupin domain-containing protein [Streptomyces sp. NPDC004609]|uniref:cupin domain-containing protein n=1 Tax=Streptomyces sp. NPDC004609 TaxID=3364704 RepID=UPI0036B8ADFD